MEFIHKFYKENDKWYMDLDEKFGIPKENLEMLEGASYMLDAICEGDDNVIVKYSTTADAFKIKNSDEKYKIPNLMVFLRESKSGGAYYRTTYYETSTNEVDMKFCDNIKLLFNDYPSVIYFKNMKLNK